ncbi:MAG: lysophospholipid acyltransferase family protein [Pseudomonadales bacterium]
MKFALNCFLWLVRILPLPLVRGLGAFIGWLAWFLNIREAKVTAVNLKLCYPELTDKERSTMARQSMQEMGVSGMDMFKVWVMPYHWLAKRITVKRQDLWEQYLVDDCGVICIPPHLGNWEVCSLWCSAQTKITAMYKPPRNKILGDLVLRQREKFGANLVPTNRRGVLAMVKALQNKEAVGILPDQMPDEEGGEYAPFFGRTVLTMKLINSLMAKSGSKALMLYTLRVPGGYELHFKEPVPEIYDEDLVIAVGGLNASVEACVREAPLQYQWEYKRFTRNPNGKTGYYEFK